MNQTAIQRRTGVALWRQIADAIRTGIASGMADESGKLPPETDLAQRFGVNRHTVRAAIAALVHERVLRAEQGRGTFVINRRRFAYPISRRTRFSAGLAGQAQNVKGHMLQAAREAASAEIAKTLRVKAGGDVVRLETLGMADGLPVSRATSWFDAQLYGGIARLVEESGSVTRALSELGVEDYLRQSTSIEAKHADDQDAADLELSPGAIVIVARAVNVLPDGAPLQYSRTRFVADRVELKLEY